MHHSTRRFFHYQQTVLDAVQETCERLSHRFCRVEDPNSIRTDAKALVANALQLKLASGNDVFIYGKRKLTALEAARLNVSVAQRAMGKPLAYIIGKKEFWSMEFFVTEHTLIPRSDSEVLIDTLVERFHPQAPLQILDIGTGTGCLLLSALSAFPRSTGVGIDVSPGALDVAKRNACFHNLNERAEFFRRDLEMLPRLQNEDKVMYKRFDVILCNPPYIPRQELHLVAPDVLEYEPHLALFSDGGHKSQDWRVDPDGLRMYRSLHESVGNLFRSNTEKKCDTAHNRDRVAKGTCLLLEVGSEKQAQAVQTLFAGKITPGGAQNTLNNKPQLQFECFLFDARRKYRGLCFTGSTS
ncbi:hypothetical protein PsorP6_009666 [Peronosclerospora sorghi]|uniref:Uncharacterized protein n=1 Tax=Peronosclerospora sorghi TaxID=230839 RepID=A0ACC0VXM6_9STRA|nr:hypothetical protein PsorP6_009666 [Peronosclerospora sorghi]